MAFSFDNIVNRIKQQFKPKTFFNVETGEIIKSKEYKKLDEEQKKLYIKETALPKEQVSAPIIDTSGYKPKGTEEVKSSRVESTEEDLTSGRIYRPKVRQRKPRGKDKKPRKKRKPSPKKETVKAKETSPKKKTYKDVKPPAPPKELTDMIQQSSELGSVTIDDLSSLKAELSQMTRHNYPWMDLSEDRNYLLSIVEEMEAYYEGTSTYEEYIKENYETISELITAIEYYDSDNPDQIKNNVIELATKLNMGVLSAMQMDTLDDLRNQWGWNTNG